MQRNLNLGGNADYIRPKCSGCYAWGVFYMHEAGTFLKGAKANETEKLSGTEI